MLNIYLYICLPIYRITSSTKELVNLYIKLLPAAFGCTSSRSPDLPMPCPIRKCRLATIFDTILASRSPTLQFEGKLLLSICERSDRNASIVASSQPSSGHFRCFSHKHCKKIRVTQSLLYARLAVSRLTCSIKCRMRFSRDFLAFRPCCT